MTFAISRIMLMPQSRSLLFLKISYEIRNAAVCLQLAFVSVRQNTYNFFFFRVLHLKCLAVHHHHGIIIIYLPLSNKTAQYNQ